MVEWKGGDFLSTALLEVNGLVVLELWADGRNAGYDALCDDKLIARGLPTLEAAQTAAIAHAVKVLTEALAQVAPELVVRPREPVPVCGDDFGAHIVEASLGTIDTAAGPREIGPGHVVLSEQRYRWLLSLATATPKIGDGHWSDCAVHNAPALEPGPCDCGQGAPKGGE